MISISVHADAFIASLDDIGRQQLPYATSRALNEVTKLAQIAIRSHTGQIWNIHRKAWIDASVKITHFSTKYIGDLYLAMGIHPPGGDERADILTKFEAETVKLPHAGTHVVVPIGMNEGKILREGQRFHDYHFVKKGNRWQDDGRKAFMVPIANGQLLVLQRVEHRVRYKRRGKAVSVAKGDNLPLFLLVPSVHITPNLMFEQTVRAVVEKEWPMQIEHYLNEAIANAK